MHTVSTPDRPLPQVRLERWAVHPVHPFQAPEQGGDVYLSGEVYGYPGRVDGERVCTGVVVSAEGRQVSTERTRYTLGEPNPDYVAWCIEKKIALDPERPIKLKVTLPTPPTALHLVSE